MASDASADGKQLAKRVRLTPIFGSQFAGFGDSAAISCAKTVDIPYPGSLDKEPVYRKNLHPARPVVA